MSIGNPVLAVKGTIKPWANRLKLGQYAADWSICPIRTVSVVYASNLRGTSEIFLCLMLVRRGSGASAPGRYSLWEISDAGADVFSA
ncbi:hypothetical protein [Pseudomonas botevensis]|uniref:hypothetical protein n=1 Tax=Pseudomonas botevensis TaxID=2842352 RepID=UPI001C3E8165|nr:hypothetical protein [Pseudomonas botevensis]MBV4476332.1 hypothetical protein [Pseudomonas botevensis]